VERTREVDVQVDTWCMVQETFQGGNESVTLEERVQEVASNAFAQADVLHNDYIENHLNDAANVRDVSTEEPIGERAEEGISKDLTFDPQVLEDAIKPLYRGAKSTELAATILLMNLCTVHGVSNNFTEELFALLHGHLLPPNNSLPKNYYAAKSLTSKLGLSYHSIHACEKGCILFQHEHSEALRCPKCGGARYRMRIVRCFR
jgi:hypothetical protein